MTGAVAPASPDARSPRSELRPARARRRAARALLLGAATTLLVAWTLQSLPRDPCPYDIVAGPPNPTALLIVERTRSRGITCLESYTAAPTDRWAQDLASNGATLALLTRWERRAAAAALDAPTDPTPAPHNRGTLQLIAAGWPWRAVRHTYRPVQGAGSPRASWALPLPGIIPFGIGARDHPRALSLRPIPLGFAGNTLFYAGTWFVLLGARKGPAARLT